MAPSVNKVSPQMDTPEYQTVEENRNETSYDNNVKDAGINDTSVTYSQVDKSYKKNAETRNDYELDNNGKREDSSMAESTPM